MKIISERTVTSPDELSRDFLVGNGISFVKSHNAWRAYGFPEGYNMQPCLNRDIPPYNKWVAFILFMEGIREGFFMIGIVVEDEKKYWPFVKKYLTEEVLVKLGYTPDEKDKCYHDILKYMDLVNKNGYEAVRISFKENFPDADSHLIMKAHVGMLIQDWVVRTHIDETMDTIYGANDDIHDEYFRRGCDKVISFLKTDAQGA